MQRQPNAETFKSTLSTWLRWLLVPQSTAPNKSAVEALETPNVNIDPLIVAVRQSIASVQPWATEHIESSNLPVVKDTLRNLQRGIRDYSSTLMESGDTANDAAEFAQRAQMLCTILIDKNTPKTEIRTHIEEMKSLAKKAHQSALSTKERFRNSRTQMNEVAKTIPGDQTALNRQELDENNRHNRAETKHDDAKTKTIIKSIIFPIGIPWFVSDAINTRRDARRVMADSERTVANCDSAREHLFKIEADIGDMMGHLDLVVDWWVQVDTMLSALNTKVAMIPNDGASRIQLEVIGDRWGGVRNKYLEYKTEVTRLSIE